MLLFWNLFSQICIDNVSQGFWCFYVNSFLGFLYSLFCNILGKAWLLYTVLSIEEEKVNSDKYYGLHVHICAFHVKNILGNFEKWLVSVTLFSQWHLKMWLVLFFLVWCLCTSKIRRASIFWICCCYLVITLTSCNNQTEDLLGARVEVDFSFPLPHTPPVVMQAIPQACLCCIPTMLSLLGRGMHTPNSWGAGSYRSGGRYIPFELVELLEKFL